MGHLLRYGFDSYPRLMGGGLGWFWLRFGQLGPDQAPVVGAQILQVKRRLKAVYFSSQRRTCDPQAAQDLIEILLTHAQLCSKCTAAVNWEHWKRHAAKSSTQLDFIKPAARFLL